MNRRWRLLLVAAVVGVAALVAAPYAVPKPSVVDTVNPAVGIMPSTLVTVGDLKSFFPHLGFGLNTESADYNNSLGVSAYYVLYKATSGATLQVFDGIDTTGQLFPMVQADYGRHRNWRYVAGDNIDGADKAFVYGSSQTQLAGIAVAVGSVNFRIEATGLHPDRYTLEGLAGQAIHRLRSAA